MSGLVVEETRLGFAIFNDAGVRVSPVFADSETALDAARRRREAGRKGKTCPCCGQKFMSMGRHNHMCTGCARRASG